MQTPCPEPQPDEMSALGEKEKQQKDLQHDIIPRVNFLLEAQDPMFQGKTHRSRCLIHLRKSSWMGVSEENLSPCPQERGGAQRRSMVVSYSCPKGSGPGFSCDGEGTVGNREESSHPPSL